jgi:nicotinate-nucleotide pyrophosphorylase (carboxylating)
VRFERRLPAGNHTGQTEGVGETGLAFPEGGAQVIVALALAEDAASDDVTTRWSVPRDLWTHAQIISRQRGVFAGAPMIAEVFRQLDQRVKVVCTVNDGEVVASGSVVAELSGPARSLVTGERTALNFLQRMSGIATLASRYVEAADGLPVRILDTRKTAPGLRELDKYAVRAGGGTNHRLNLGAMVLLKENHIAAAGGVSAALAAARRGMAAAGRRILIEVEVQTVDQAQEALAARASWIMLDNMRLPQMRQVVAMRDGWPTGSRALLEASGSIGIRRLRSVAETGVDAISAGALTHSAPALDLSMLMRGRPQATGGSLPLAAARLSP